MNKKQAVLLSMCVAGSIFGGAVQPAFAAENFNEGNLSKLHAECPHFQLMDMIITATKTPLEEKKVPMAVEVINSEDIKNMGAYSVQDALRMAENVSVIDAGMTGNVVQIRGMSTNHALILVDGRRMAAENSNNTMNVYALKRLNVNDVERIEVIRGNGSALYGSDAMGGVINIITKKNFHERSNAFAHIGSKDQGVGYSYSTGQRGKVSADISVADEKVRKNNLSCYSKKNNSDNDGSNMYGRRRFLNMGIDYEFDMDHGLVFDMNFMREKLKSDSVEFTRKGGKPVKPGKPGMKPGMGGGKPANPGMKPGMGGGKPANPGMKPGMGGGHGAGGGKPVMPPMPPMKPAPNPSIGLYSYDNNRSDYSLKYYGRDGKHDYMLRAYYNTLHKYSETLENNEYTDFDYTDYSILTGEASDTIRLDDAHCLTGGVEFSRRFMKGTRFGGGADKPFTEEKYGIVRKGSEKSIDTFAGYLEDEWQVNDKLFLIPAVRVDHHEAFGTHVSPKLGGTLNFSDNSRIKFNYGKGFRAPTIFELYSTMEKRMGGMTVNVLGDENLDPEKSNNFDISLEGEKGKLSAKATYFHNEVTNLITAKFIGREMDMSSMPPKITLKTQYINIDEAEINGVEGSLNYDFDEHWSLGTTYAYLDATNSKTGERLEGRAKNKGTVRLSYTDASDMPLTMNLWNDWYEGYIHNDNSYDYSVTNFVVNKQLNSSMDVYAGVDNIFDKNFKYDDDHTFRISGRTWRAGLEMKF